MKKITPLLGGILIIILFMTMLNACSLGIPADSEDRLVKPTDNSVPTQPENPTEPGQPAEPTAYPVEPVKGDIPAPKGMTAFIVASGAPAAGSADQREPVLFALKSIEAGDTNEASLPEEARTVLRNALKEYPDDLMIVVYTGYKGSSGFSVAVTKVEETVDGLKVIYHVTAPSPKAIVLTVLTHPYMIVWLTGADVNPENVEFIEE